MTPEMKAGFRVMEADLIADVVALTEVREKEERAVRHLGHKAEAFSLILISALGIACLIIGIGSLPADLVMVIPNAGILIYRRLRDF